MNSKFEVELFLFIIYGCKVLVIKIENEFLTMYTPFRNAHYLLYVCIHKKFLAYYFWSLVKGICNQYYFGVAW